MSSIKCPTKSTKFKQNKNPYSTRGLDKFSALLAELEEKKQKIYSQVGSEHISLVRFKYNYSNECVPVVVKLKNKQQQHQQHKTKTKMVDVKEKDSSNKQEQQKKHKIFLACNKKTTPMKKPQHRQQEENRFKIVDVKEKRIISSEIVLKQNKPDRNMIEEDESELCDKKKITWNMKIYKLLERPGYYLPVVLIFILFFLAFFGRSFVVLCTCVGWYMLPILKGKTEKDYVTKFSDDRKMAKTNAMLLSGNWKSW